MPEKGTAGTSKLVLGFDGGCATCGDLAAKISEGVGDKLEVRSLRHPQVEHWRDRALGKDAPWAPALFEVVSDDEVKAWMGVGLAVKLARVLGPLSTWRVMQALGETGKPGATSPGGSTRAAEIAAAGVSRGQFLKGMGGSALALGVLAGVGAPAQAAPEEEVDFDELTEAFAAIEEIPDSVIRRGDRAVRQWLRRRLGLDEPSPKGFWGCVRAIGFALVSNAIPVSKILKIRAAIRAVGGVGNFVRILRLAYATGRKKGYSRWGAIRYAAKRAADASGRNIVDALIGLFALDGVRRNCF